MSKSRMPLVLGATAVGGIGYYLYSAGGKPKVAQKEAEADAYSTSARLKSELPGRGKEAEKDLEKYGAQAGAQADRAYGKSKAELQKAAAEAEAYAKETGDATMKKVNEFDKKVEAEASKAKGGLSSWFGGSK
ncbi:hypothetical protein DL768_001900 [Monosporascus sp. mg162]|nr:hypothetical protein DL768_001900 [Monosporascus sp. mg162]